MKLSDATGNSWGDDGNVRGGEAQADYLTPHTKGSAKAAERRLREGPLHGEPLKPRSTKDRAAFAPSFVASS